VGIERRIGIFVDGDVVMSTSEAQHAAALTRETVTPAVHYLRFAFTEAQVAAFGDAAELPWRRSIPPTRPGPSCRPPCGMSCSETCWAQQKPYLSADQGQFRAQAFTGAEDLSHTLRSPKFGNGAAGRCIERASEQGECNGPLMYQFNEEVFPMIATTWRKQAACRGLDVEAFYPVTEDEADAAEAKAVCAVCPVRQACLEHALAHREREGIWGGTTERERRRIVRQRRKSA
jgi:WhiB family transcriptional regulator, redox-sensing transcriptional regulator